MSELSYKELQEQGVFDVPYRAFKYMQSQQAKIDELQKLRSLDEMAINQLAQANQVWQIKCDELQGRIDDASNKIDFWVGGKNGDAIHVAKSIGNILKGNKDEN